MTTSASHKKTKFLTLSLYFITIYRMSDREGERESGGTGSESERKKVRLGARHMTGGRGAERQSMRASTINTIIPKYWSLFNTNIKHCFIKI